MHILMEVPVVSVNEMKRKNMMEKVEEWEKETHVLPQASSPKQFLAPHSRPLHYLMYNLTSESPEMSQAAQLMQRTDHDATGL